MNGLIAPISGTSQHYEMIFRRENFGIPELEKQKAQYINGSPGYIAAVKLIVEKQMELDSKRHSEVVGEAKGANYLAKWAIVIAIVAIIVSVLGSVLNLK